VAYIIDGKSLVLLQVNCSTIYNKTLDFWNSVYIHNADVISTELAKRGNSKCPFV
jgi:hypothetical protein